MTKHGQKLFLVLMLLIVTFASQVMAQHVNSVAAYQAESPVTIDGKWTTPDEWTDAANVTFGYGSFGERQHFHVKHDTGFLYVLVDFVADKTLDDKDNSWVYLDTNGDRGTAPRNDDYGFGINFLAGQPIFIMRLGNGTGWKELAPSSRPPIEGFWAWASMDPSNDPYLSTPHSIYEFKIPKTILDSSTTIGFRVVAGDGLGQVEWPSRSSLNFPCGWGTLTFLNAEGLLVQIEGPLIKTRWDQTGLYASKSPVIRGQHVRVGCWSTAIGQIINFHRLEPYGKVRYVCRNGIVIENDLDARVYNWSRMSVCLTNTSPKEEVEEVSTLLYDVATVIQKDFDTDTYVIDETKMVLELQEHFRCYAEAVSTNNIGRRIKDYIAQELDARRPCMLYMEDIKRTTGHAVVIDGWRRDGNTFLVHLNMGWEGKDDGWYDFDQPINVFNNPSFRLVLSIRPRDVSGSPRANGILKSIGGIQAEVICGGTGRYAESHVNVSAEVSIIPVEYFQYAVAATMLTAASITAQVLGNGFRQGRIFR